MAGGIRIRPPLVVLVAVSAAVAGDAVASSGGQDGGVLFLTPAELEVGAVREAGADFATLGPTGAGLQAEVGSPAVPVYRRLVEVPYAREVTASAEAGATETRQLARSVVPRQEPVPQSGPAPAFALNAKVYSTDAPAPDVGAKPVEVAVVRGRRSGLRIDGRLFRRRRATPGTGSWLERRRGRTGPRAVRRRCP